MQKTLIVVLLIAVIVLAGVVVYQKLTPTETTTPIIINQPVVNQPTVNQPANNQPSTSCFKEGVPFIDPTSQFCCDQSLNKIIHSYYDKNGKCLTDAEDSIIADETYVCAACGNGVCGKGENKCNCPQDCK